ncbi:DHH family phosphoesterase [Candidatus Saccharibacteria bacterium]|nr:DHH family phosphoesterase [Candidatus Saccharibacteria bacterium]
MYDIFSEFLKDKKRICIIQAENPDGDSLGSALALDYLLNDYEISLYCPVEIPKYLRYLDDWSRVSIDFDFNADGYIIVDTAAQILLSKLLENPAIKERLISSDVFVLDHHETEDDIEFGHQGLIQTLPSCTDLIYRIAREQNLMPATKDVKEEDKERFKIVAEYLIAGILSDTLGLTSASTTSELYREVADLLDYGINIAEFEEHRRDFMKKSQRILNYKADLIKKVEYFLDGRLATVHIPWEEIQEYSDEYNPNVLILEELRLVEGVEVAICFKTYPDGKITGKIRTSKPIADKIAGFFGGGGHPYAAGFRTYDLSYDDAIHETIEAIDKIEREENEAL